MASTLQLVHIYAIKQPPATFLSHVIANYVPEKKCPPNWAYMKYILSYTWTYVDRVYTYIWATYEVTAISHAASSTVHLFDIITEQI